MQRERIINNDRFIRRIGELGQIGRDQEGRLSRLAATEEDREARDQVVQWMKEADLEVSVDRIGNIFGIWETDGNQGQDPVMIGSHIDTVINGGILDGAYGVVAGIEVITALKEKGFNPPRPIVVAVFTNEEGVRYTTDMIGSLVYAGGMSTEEALAIPGIDGTTLGEELKHIGYAGDREPGFLKPHAFVELHIEQGPILDGEKIPVGAVENLQGLIWKRITIHGTANHAGTTPTAMRKDAGLAAAKVITFLRERCLLRETTVATVGCMELEPNAINVIPSRATFTLDLRNPHRDELKEEEQALEKHLKEIEESEGVTISVEELVRLDPVDFDQRIVSIIEKAAKERGLPARRMTSGAGHDAQMMARICPTAMIFVPSTGGISHSPKESTPDRNLAEGASVLADVVSELTETKEMME